MAKTRTRKKKKWIKGAIKRPGALTKKAKAAGMSTQAYARKKKGASGRTGRQARLALTLAKLRKKKKRRPKKRR